jgi:hypothetical protein
MPFCRRPAVGWMRNLSGYLRRRLQSSYGIPNGVSPILDLGNQRLSGHSWNRQVPTLPTRTAGELTFKTECRPLLHWTPRQKACGSVWGTQLWNPNSPAEVLKGSVISWLVGKRPISGMPIYFDKLLSSCRNLKRWNDYLHENPDCWCLSATILPVNLDVLWSTKIRNLSCPSEHDQHWPTFCSQNMDN